MTSTLELKDIALSRGEKKVLHGVSVDVHSGEIVALLGANGAGKSSLVLGACGMLPLDAGKILVDGEDLTRMAAYDIRAAGIAAVPEGHNVLSDLSVQENLETAGAFLSRPSVRSGIEFAYETFPELTKHRDQAANSLSGGQQQMLVLGQALVGQPKVILADEMSLGLAPLIVNRLLEVVKTLAENGTGILLIEQFTHLALKLSSRAIVMDRGTIAFSGQSREVEARPDILHQAYLSVGG